MKMRPWFRVFILLYMTFFFSPSLIAQVFNPDPKRPHAHPYYWAPFILIGNWK
jgi:CHAT domain-containing protein